MERNVEHARLVDHAGKLSLRVEELCEVLIESDFCASEAGRSVTDRADVGGHAHGDRERARAVGQAPRSPAAGLRPVYLVLACLVFTAVSRIAIRSGLIARYSAETVS